jgi:YbbR domain-containing protein
MPEEKRRKTSTGLKIISVLLSVLLWFYVVNQNETVTGANTVEAQLSYNNVPANLTVVGPETVKVRVWGALRDTGPVVAYVDLTGLKIGEHSVPVHVQPVKGAMFASVEPDKVTVRLENIKERMVSISTEVKVNPPAGYKLMEITTSPEKCLIRGEKDIVASISSVVASVQLGEATDITTQKVTLQARNALGKPVTEGITLSPTSAEVYAIVERQKNIKKVPVKAILQGQLPNGYRLVSVSADPAEVSVLAFEASLENLTEIQTLPLDLSNRQGDFTELLGLSVPEGAAATPSQVQVNVKIEKTTSEEVQQ